MIKAALLALSLLLAAPASAQSDEMFDKLKAAPSDEEALAVASDIIAAWLDSDSPTINILMERAIVSQAHGDVDHARALYDRAIQIEPAYAEAWHRRASLFVEEERYDEALRDLDATLAIEPRHFGAWLGTAMILERLGGKQEALEAYEQALDIFPRLPAARYARDRLRDELDGTAL